MKDHIKPIISGVLVLFACLGLGRFVFGMILPNMQVDLGMSISEAGLLGTSNFIGYLLGLVFAGIFYSKFGPKKLISRSLLTQSASMLLMSLSSNFYQISFFYFMCGFFGSLATIAIMSYITQNVPRNIRGKAAGLLYAGGGSAIVLSGYTVPFMDKIYSTQSWRYTWGLFAIFTLLIAFFIWFNLVEKPLHVNKTKNNEHPLAILKDRRFIRIGVLYFCFGITYVIYVTFFVVASMDRWQISSNLSSSFWVLLGFLSIFSGPIFGALSDKIGRYKTISVVFLVQCIANVIMSIELPISYLWVSASLFGISVWAIPSIMAVLTAETFGIEKTATIFSKITLVFAIGQILGPVGAGYITDFMHDFSYAFAFSSLVTFVAFGFSIKFLIKNKQII